MKANELMQGDIVIYEYDGQKFPARVIEIYRNSVLVESINGEYEPIEIEEDKIFPVQLTQEILEKNGFTVGKYKLPLSDEEIDKFSLSEVGDDYVREVVLLPLTMNYTWSFGSVDGTDIPVIQSLHELQHALSLCGIEHDFKL